MLSYKKKGPKEQTRDRYDIYVQAFAKKHVNSNAGFISQAHDFLYLIGFHGVAVACGDDVCLGYALAEAYSVFAKCSFIDANTKVSFWLSWNSICDRTPRTPTSYTTVLNCLHKNREAYLCPISEDPTEKEYVYFTK